MSTTMITPKTTGLAKSSAFTRTVATRINRAFEMRNEKVARADSELMEAVKRAAADIAKAEAEAAGDDTPAVSPADVPEQAAS
jgi:hypothetical protein